MNIFVLSSSAYHAAVYQCDKHVVKMVTETAQMLSTAHHVHGGDVSGLYKPTHIHHPCTQWVCETVGNYRWTFALFEALLHEYTDRYEKTHACARLYNQLINHPDNLPVGNGRTPFVQCMPDQYKSDDPVEAYRNFYIHEKARFAKWRLGNVPEWFLTMENQNADLFI